MENQDRKNPWLGLQSYTEYDRIYGRDADIRALTQAVLNNKELLFYGKSGIGKSSILMAGLVGMCRQHGYVPISMRLEHSGIKYIDQIKQALEAESIRVVRKEAVCGNDETLWEFFHCNEFRKTNRDITTNEEAIGERVNLLFIFDQFEEIFTLSRNKVQIRDFFAELADYLNDIEPEKISKNKANVEVNTDVQSGDDMFGDIFSSVASEESKDYVFDNNIHMIFTIREDFLSEFEYYAKATPSLKQHRYQLRPLNEEQAAEIITKPRPGMVSKEVAKLIIEKVAGRTDFILDGIPEIEVDSAVLSLYLEQLYEAKEEETITKELVEEKGGRIIEEFYDKVASQVSKSAIIYLENELINDDGRRENRSISTIEHHIGGETLETLISLQLLRQFRRGDDLMIEFIHDILCPIIQKHKEGRLIEQRINKRRKVTRWITRVVASLLLLIAGFICWGYFIYEKEYSLCYENFVRVNGFPVGIGEPMDDDAIGDRMVVYRLVRRGLSKSNKNIRLEVIRKEPLAASGVEMPLVGEAEMETDENAKHFARKLQNVEKIYFVGRDKIQREFAKDDRGNVLYSINYYNEGKWNWACFVNENGSPMHIRKNADRMKILYDANGYERKILFYDMTLVPQTNYVGFYGIELTYDSLGRRDTVWTLDPFGDKKSAQIWCYSDDKIAIKSDNRILYELQYNDDGTLSKRIKKGTYKDDTVTKYTYENGRLVSVTTSSGSKVLAQFETRFGKNWTDTIMIDLHDSLCYRQHTVKDEHNRIVSISFYDAATDKPIISSIIQAHKMQTEWDSIGNGYVRQTNSFYDVEGNLIEDEDGTSIGVRLYNKENKLVLWLSKRNDGTRVRSMRYEYKNGVEYKRYAVGVDGTPIRCASWEQDGMVYYQLSLKQDANGNFVNGLAKNEWGEASLFYRPELMDYQSVTIGDDNITFNSYEDEMWSCASTTLLHFKRPDNLKSADYIHILSKNGAAYRSGLRDGDIIIKGELKAGSSITVKRIGTKERPRTITIDKGELNAEHYVIYLTKQEYEKM